MLLLLEFGQFVLPIRVKLSIVFGDVLDFRGFEDETHISLASNLSWVESQASSLRVDDVLMVEILVSSQEVLYVAKRNLTSTLNITSNHFPNFGQLVLLRLFRDWSDESKLEEDLGHLGATNICLEKSSLVSEDAELLASHVEMVMVPVMLNVVGS